MHILIGENARGHLGGIATYISHSCDEHSLAYAQDFDDLLIKAGDTTPDAILIDEFLDGAKLLPGLEALHERSPGSKLAVVCDTVTLGKVHRLLEGGADGCIDGNLKAEALPWVLALMLAGEKYVPPAIFTRPAAVEPGLNEMSQAPYEATRAGFPELTPREAEILSMLVTGATNKEIADYLSRKEITITSHLKQIFRKLGAGNRTQAALVALCRLYGYPSADYAHAQNVSVPPANMANPGERNENTSS